MESQISQNIQIFLSTKSCIFLISPVLPVLVIFAHFAKELSYNLKKKKMY